MKKLIIFDWNATLLSDTKATMEADNLILKTFGGKPVDFKTYQDTIEIPAANFYALHGCSKTEMRRKEKKLVKIFRDFYEVRANKCRTRKGAKDLLKWLKKNSVNSIILSNHTVDGINNQLERLGLVEFISEVVANPSVGTILFHRNKKEKLDDYLKKCNYKKSEMIIIGDGPEEVEIGKYFGITTTAITNGYYSKARLKATQPDYLVGSLKEFKKILENLY